MDNKIHSELKERIDIYVLKKTKENMISYNFNLSL